MKLKYAWVALIALTIFGCTDNTGSLGLGMFPEGDQNIKGNLMTFEATTQSELAGRTFAKTNYGYIGKFTDPNFGYYEAGFLAQLHCNKNMTFPTVYDKNTNPTGLMVNDGIYLTELVLSYASYFGDSLAPCRMSIYELDKALDKEEAHYTDIDPTKYYKVGDPKSLIGNKSYTAVDLSLSDSIRKLEGFYPFVRISLPTEIGTRIYEAAKATGDERVITNSKFQELFKGIYAKSTYGDGTVLYIDQIQMNVVYEVYVKDSLNRNIKKKVPEKDGVTFKDSTAYSKKTFAATKEIIQANRFKNDENKIVAKRDENKWTYLKTPAGLYTQATLPLKGIEEKLSQDTINAVKLAFTNYNQTNDNNKYKYGISAPDYVLLVREKDKEAFFKGNQRPDGITSYLSQHNATATNQYVFSNLARLVSTCIAEKSAIEKKFKAGGFTIEVTRRKKDANGYIIENGGYVYEKKTATNITEWMEYSEWDKVALIPVLVSKDASNASNVISVQNDLRPGYAKLKGGALGLNPANAENRLALDVIYTSFNKK